MKPELPDLVPEFLKTPPARHAERVIRIFHRWLTDRGVVIAELERKHVDGFLACPAGETITALTRNDYRYKIRRYVDWLHLKGIIDFDAAWLRVRHQMLPAHAEQFLTSLEPTLRPATCGQYRGSLRELHNWLAKEGRPLETLRREEVSLWMQHLAAKGQAPATRLNIIVAVRVYLRALNDAGILREPADDLIRQSDLPKLPRYLPRPLEPATDEILRERLAAADDQYQLGLLVMRNTGMRIGELASVEFNCLRNDPGGNRFLKVPLGKLNSERLVPIDQSTYELIRRLQGQGTSPRTWLLETINGRKARYEHFRVAIETATEGLEIPNGMTSHRLRHTYATSMLSGGMSLLGVMKLLGHRDYRMTLRYTEITLETVGKEYRSALTQLEKRYRIALKSKAPRSLDPDQALANIIRWVQKRAGDDPQAKRRALLLVKRLKRIREEVGEL